MLQLDIDEALFFIVCRVCFAKIVTRVWYCLAKLVDGSGVAEGGYLLQTSVMRLQILIHSEC